MAIGRTPDGTGQIQFLASATKGGPNSGALPTPTPIKLSSTITAVSPTSKLVATSKKTTSVKNSFETSPGPTSVLEVSTKTKAPSVTPSKNKRVLVDASSDNKIPLFAVIGISLLLFSCAIIAYFRITNDKTHDTGT